MSDGANNEKTSDEATSAFVSYVLEQLKNRVPETTIVNSLAEKGVEYHVAEEFVAKCRDAYGSARRKAGMKDMLIGGLWCVGGGIVTALTYSMASSGGRYVIAWGAIVFGAVQFFRGLYRTVRG